MEYKTYVRVKAEFDTDGNVVPTHIIWNDERIFSIDRILDIRRCASTRAGGMGIRYTVRIEGREKYLFYENPKWFVEAR
ncbi:MAG: hypothetical protein RSB78_07080 [Oscillospiraceae bacterium]